MTTNTVPSLRDADLTLTLSRKEANGRIEVAQRRILQLRLQLGGKLGTGDLGPPVCFVFEGWDASGKGGAIKVLVAPMDPRHVRVVQIAAPTRDELRHHWLQRFWPELPGWGGVAVLDRSWYGRVLVERVEGFATTDQWRRAYTEIVDFERTLVAEGMVFGKFWMHISQEEQLSRFEAREKSPLKQWKLTEEDWRNRKKHAEYWIAVEEMLARTSWTDGPWYVVPAEQKRYGRVFVLENAISVVEGGMRRYGMEPVAPLEGDERLEASD
jgi:polyphosphate kinase 2 (PPK2 family)